MTDHKGCIMWQKPDKKNDVTNRSRVVYIEIETKFTDRTRCDLWQELDRRLTWLILQVQSMMKIKLNYPDKLYQVWFMMKTTQYNDVTDPTNVVYAEDEIELSWLIGKGAICKENQIGKWCDRKYRGCLRQNWYLTVVTNQIGYGLWQKSSRTTTTWPIV